MEFRNLRVVSSDPSTVSELQTEGFGILQIPRTQYLNHSFTFLVQISKSVVCLSCFLVKSPIVGCKNCRLS